jgi:DUF1009 family protein
VRLALIAGRGGLPARVAQAQTEPPLVCALAGFEPENLRADLTFRLETLGTLLNELVARGVTDVCFCGGIDRPALDQRAIDKATVPLIPVLAQALSSGDDSALGAIIGLFEDKGFSVRAAHELAPEILAPEGVLTTTWPDDYICEDVARGKAVLAALAPLDVGQACVVGRGLVWGIETLGGTDHMLATLPVEVRTARASLIKIPKAGQDLRADMPTVGPATIDAIVSAGLAALVIEAGHVILMEPEETLKRANVAGLVLWSRGQI